MLYIHSKQKKVGNALTSRYELLKPIDFPTLFKYQLSDVNESIAKRHTDGIIYTDTRYYALASQKSHIEKLYSYSPNVSVGRVEEIAALGGTIYGAERSSRLVPCGASPSSDPGVRLSRTGLLAKLIIQQLSVYTDI